MVGIADLCRSRQFKHKHFLYLHESILFYTGIIYYLKRYEKKTVYSSFGNLNEINAYNKCN